MTTKTDWRTILREVLKQSHASVAEMESFRDSDATTFEEFWDSMDRPDWLILSAINVGIDHALMVDVIRQCATNCLQYAHSGDSSFANVANSSVADATDLANAADTTNNIANTAVRIINNVADAAYAYAVASDFDSAHVARGKACAELCAIIRKAITAEMIWEQIMKGDMRRFEVPIIYKGKCNFIVDAPNEAKAREIAKSRFEGGDAPDDLGNEQEEFDGFGEVTDLSNCECCGGSGIRVDATPHAGSPPEGYVVIERCDACARYASDLDAAQAWGGYAKWQDGNGTSQAIALPKPVNTSH